MKLKEGEKIIFDESPIIRNSPVVFSDNDSFPTQMGRIGFCRLVLTNKRVIIETKALHQEVLNLDLNNIKAVRVKRVLLFWKYLVIDSKIQIGFLLKKTHRAWIKLGSHAQEWADKINELIGL